MNTLEVNKPSPTALRKLTVLGRGLLNTLPTASNYPLNLFLLLSFFFLPHP